MSVNCIRVIEGNELRKLNEVVALESMNQFIINDKFYDYVTEDILKTNYWNLRHNGRLFYPIDMSSTNHGLLKAAAKANGFQSGNELLLVEVPWDHQNIKSLPHLKTIQQFITVAKSMKYIHFYLNGVSQNADKALNILNIKNKDFICSRGFYNIDDLLEGNFTVSEINELVDEMAFLYRDLIMLEMDAAFYDFKQFMDKFNPKSSLSRISLSSKVSGHKVPSLVWFERKVHTYPDKKIIISDGNHRLIREFYYSQPYTSNDYIIIKTDPNAKFKKYLANYIAVDDTLSYADRFKLMVKLNEPDFPYAIIKEVLKANALEYIETMNELTPEIKQEIREELISNKFDIFDVLCDSDNGDEVPKIDHTHFILAKSSIQCISETLRKIKDGIEPVNTMSDQEDTKIESTSIGHETKEIDPNHSKTSDELDQEIRITFMKLQHDYRNRHLDDEVFDELVSKHIKDLQEKKLKKDIMERINEVKPLTNEQQEEMLSDSFPIIDLSSMGKEKKPME